MRVIRVAAPRPVGAMQVFNVAHRCKIEEYERLDAMNAEPTLADMVVPDVIMRITKRKVDPRKERMLIKWTGECHECHQRYKATIVKEWKPVAWESQG